MMTAISTDIHKHQHNPPAQHDTTLHPATPNPQAHIKENNKTDAANCTMTPAATSSTLEPLTTPKLLHSAMKEVEENIDEDDTNFNLNDSMDTQEKSIKLKLLES